jgi:amino acid transporter
MKRRFTRPRVLLLLSLGVGIAFLLLGLPTALAYPVKGIPLYGKFILGAVFCAGVGYSFYLEGKRKEGTSELDHKGEKRTKHNQPAENRP